MDKLIGNIRLFRQLRYLSQAHMAQVLNMSQTKYVGLEKGKVPVSSAMLEQIAERLECSKDVLLHFDAEGITPECKKKDLKHFFTESATEYEKRIDMLETRLSELFSLVVKLTEQQLPGKQQEQCN